MKEAAAFNRWMRKTARPVVWEGAGAQSSAPDPIGPFAAASSSVRICWVFSQGKAFEPGLRLRLLALLNKRGQLIAIR